MDFAVIVALPFIEPIDMWLHGEGSMYIVSSISNERYSHVLADYYEFKPADKNRLRLIDVDLINRPEKWLACVVWRSAFQVGLCKIDRVGVQPIAPTPVSTQPLDPLAWVLSLGAEQPSNPRLDKRTHT
ncbi:hypothetical protein [Methylobacterium sp. WL7]|jgi:hypothetical protein|uniref:hypothetical protein n=1 Tax=Methylobacterium sp. WL7 TaxID=2603900 RepID=UPI0011CAF34C|nr:hypothetical protein [Methylobacterium sp. WL7]TXN46556.1 hypothetical protein FV233_07490 [Methylobacterium sp. WL7]